MGKEETEQKSDGKGLFIIRNGQKVAQYEGGKWKPLLPRSLRPQYAGRH